MKKWPIILAIGIFLSILLPIGVALLLSYGIGDYPDWYNRETPTSGTIEFLDGTYTGDILNGTRQGYGTMTYKDGGVYEGFWSHNVRSGQGTYTYPNGDVYVGGWLNDKREGSGVLTRADGSVQAGIWGNDKYVGEAPV